MHLRAAVRDAAQLVAATSYTLGATVSQYSMDAVTGALLPQTPATVVAGTSPERVTVTPDGKSAYVTNGDGVPGPGNAVLQYDINPLTGALSPKNPASVSAGAFPSAIAVTPLPRVPTDKQQCKNGGWRTFPQFKNHGDCVSLQVVPLQTGSPSLTGLPVRTVRPYTTVHVGTIG